MIPVYDNTIADPIRTPLNWLVAALWFASLLLTVAMEWVMG